MLSCLAVLSRPVKRLVVIDSVVCIDRVHAFYVIPMLSRLEVYVVGFWCQNTVIC